MFKLKVHVWVDSHSVQIGVIPSAESNSHLMQLSFTVLQSGQFVKEVTAAGSVKYLLFRHVLQITVSTSHATQPVTSVLHLLHVLVALNH